MLIRGRIAWVVLGGVALLFVLNSFLILSWSKSDTFYKLRLESADQNQEELTDQIKELKASKDAALLQMRASVRNHTLVIETQRNLVKKLKEKMLIETDFVLSDMDQTLHHQLIIARRCRAYRDKDVDAQANLDNSVLKCLIYLLKPTTILRVGIWDASVSRLISFLQERDGFTVMDCTPPIDPGAQVCVEMSALTPGKDMILIGHVDPSVRLPVLKLIGLIPSDMIVGVENANSDQEWSTLIKTAQSLITLMANGELERRYPIEMKTLLPAFLHDAKQALDPARSFWARTRTENLRGGVPTSLAHVLHYQVEQDTPAWGSYDLDTVVWQDGLVGGPFPSRIIGQGKAVKVVNGPIFSVGRGFINAEPSAGEGVNYRIMSLRWKIDYSQILAEESVESDVCLTVMPIAMQNSQSSGHELLCTHEHVTGRGPFGETSQVFPLGGFVLKPGYKAVIASVSNIYPTKDFNIEPHSSRFLKNQKEFLALEYRMEMVREDLVPLPALTSVRSPFRDRSFNTASRPFAPYTDFKNVANRPVHVFGIGVFLSALSHLEKQHHFLKIFVNEVLVYEETLPDHDPRYTSGRATHIFPFDRLLAPGAVLSARCTFESQTSYISDFAAYILSDAEEGHLIKVNEVQLLPGKIDVNNDGVFDNIDFDAMGSIWVEQSAGRTGDSENHDTQFEWIKHLFNYAGPLLNREDIHDFVSFIGGGGTEAAPSPYITIHDPNPGGSDLCMHFFLRPGAWGGFDIEYCQSNVPTPARDDIIQWGDFNGDGYPDRVRVEWPMRRAPMGKTDKQRARIRSAKKWKDTPIALQCPNKNQCDDDRALKRRYIAFGGPDGMLKEEGWRQAGDHGPWADPMCLNHLFARPDPHVFKRDWLVLSCPNRATMHTMLFDPDNLA